MKRIVLKNSKNEELNLLERPYQMLTETTLLDSAWSAVKVGVSSEKIVGFEKGSVAHSFSVMVSGENEAEMLSNLEALAQFIDYDVVMNRKGRLYVGDFYLEGFVSSSRKEKVFGRNITKVDLTLVSEDGFWKKEQKMYLNGYCYDNGTEIASNVYCYANSYSATQPFEVEGNADGTVRISWHPSAPQSGIEFIFDFGENPPLVEKVYNLILCAYYMNPPTGTIEIQTGDDLEQMGTEREIASFSYDTTPTVELDLDIDNAGVPFRYLRIINTTYGRFGLACEELSIQVSSDIRHARIDNLGFTCKGCEAEITTDTWQFHELEVNAYEIGATIHFNSKDVNLEEFAFDRYNASEEVIGELQRLVNGEWVRVYQISNAAEWLTDLECEELRIIFNQKGRFTFNEFFLIGIISNETIENDNYVPIDCIIRFHFPVNNPSLIIGENDYGADVDVSEEKMLEINTEKKTVRLYDEDGTFENVYASTTGGFEKIEAGENETSWKGNPRIELVEIQKRSEPKWD